MDAVHSRVDLVLLEEKLLNSDDDKIVQRELAYLRELRYGFEADRLCIRLDAFAGALAELEDAEFRVSIQGNTLVTVMAKLTRGKLVEYAVEQERICLLNPARSAEAAFEQILELAINKDLLDFRGLPRLRLAVALWHGGLPVDVLPAEGVLEIQLGEEHFGWPVEALAS